MSKAHIPSAYEALSPELAEILGAREPQSIFTNVGSVAATSLGPAGAPVVGQHFSRHVEEGNYGDALLDLIDLIPGAGLFKALGAKALPYLSTFLPAGRLGLNPALATAAKEAGEDIGPGSAFHQKTKMFEAPDGSILTEISDHEARLTGASPKAGRSIPFGEMVNHPRLFELLPETRDTPVRMLSPRDVERFPTTKAAFDPDTGRVGYSPNMDDDERLRRLMHEVAGHKVQKVTGQDIGGNPERYFSELASNPRSAELDYFYTPAEAKALIKNQAFNRYKDKQGEFLARDIEARLKMTPQQREKLPPLQGKVEDKLWWEGSDPGWSDRVLDELSRGLFGS